MKTSTFSRWMFLILTIKLVSAQTQAQATPGAGHYQSIEVKARRADVRNRQSIQDLAHEVITSPHYFPVPDTVASLLEDKLTDAEINYRNSTGHGVSESQIVDLLNWVGDKLHLPSYAVTTAAQVRTLRMKLVLMSPNLMGSSLGGKEITKGGHVRTVMSPIQAMHLLNVVFDQKVTNPDYQDPSIDLVRADRLRDNAPRGTTQGKLASTGTSSNPKKKEVRDAIWAAESQMTMQDAYDMVNHAFKTLQLN